MSFKFEYQSKQYWAKQLRGQTEVYLLGVPGLAEKVLVLDGKPTQDDIVQTLSGGTVDKSKTHADDGATNGAAQ